MHSGILSVTQATPRGKTPGTNRDLWRPPSWSWGPCTRCNRGVTTTAPRDYGLAPQLRARLMGTFLAAIGVVLLTMTVVVVAFKLPADVLSGLVILTVVGIFSLGFLLVRRWYVVRLDDIGYQVRFVRGAGQAKARWVDVLDLATNEVQGAKCVVLRLRNGSATTIPVDLIEGDKEAFVDELRSRLNGGNGYRPISG